MRKLGKKMLIPLIIALALVLGGAMGAFGLTSSGLPFESKDYKAQFYLNHLQVHLLENGKDVCGGKNTLDGESKVSGDLVKDLGYSRAENTDGKEVLGSVEPGKLYAEKIQAKNGQVGFYRYTAGRTLNAYKAYIPGSVAANGLRAFVIDVDGGAATPIELIFDDEPESHANIVYDLQGRRVAQPQKGGIYIINGKKVYMR